MTTNHAAVAALPVNGSADKLLLRNAITARMPYVLADNENATDLVAVDPDTGAAIVDMTFLGRQFHYDPTDVTTAHDGVTCLVSSDGRRYKLSDGFSVFCYSVIDRTHTAPPASPSLGDAYLVATAATGGWAGKDGNVAVRTARGWEFVAFGVGRFIYVEAEDTYYHRNAGGAWVSGFGSQTPLAKSIPLSAAINFGKRLIVESQTINTPPASPSIGDAYIIGNAPTGAWAGSTAKIAVCEVAGGWTIYPPTNGWAVYDKAQNSEYVFNGSAWTAARGAWLRYVATALTPVPSTPGSGQPNIYGYSGTVPPNTFNLATLDNTSKLPYAALKTGAKLRVRYRCDGGLNAGIHVVGLFRDSESDAIDWALFVSTSGSFSLNQEFIVNTGDALSHTYSVRIMPSVSNSTAIFRSMMSIEEAA